MRMTRHCGVNDNHDVNVAAGLVVEAVDGILLAEF
jgi:hypothetical protein